jgi:hypothetical protein
MHKHAADMSPHELAKHLWVEHGIGTIEGAIPISPGEHLYNYTFHEEDDRNLYGIEHDHDVSRSPYGTRPANPNRN